MNLLNGIWMFYEKNLNTSRIHLIRNRTFGNQISSRKFWQKFNMEMDDQE